MRILFLGASLFVINVFIVSLFLDSFANGYYFGYRFLLSAFPLTFIGIAVMCGRLFEYDRIAAMFIAGIITFTNLFHKAPEWVFGEFAKEHLDKYEFSIAQMSQPSSLMREYYFEVLNQRPKLSPAIIKFLNRFAEETDLVVADPALKDMIYFECGLVTYSSVDSDGTVSNLSKEDSRRPVAYPVSPIAAVGIEDIS